MSHDELVEKIEVLTHENGMLAARLEKLELGFKLQMLATRGRPCYQPRPRPPRRQWDNERDTLLP
jgi:hypothetical protein